MQIMKKSNALPIKTIKDGNVTTKVCVEDIYKLVGKVREQLDKSSKESDAILESMYKEIEGVRGYLVMSIGTSKPCLLDAYDEEIGNNIAFMKAKFKANYKKLRMLEKICNSQGKLWNVLEDEIQKIWNYIDMDLDGIRKHNPDYLIDQFPNYPKEYYEEIEENEAETGSQD